MPVFSTADGVFSLDGKPMTILSGAIHYFRTHPDQWRDRLEKLKDCGFNTVETYTPWNLHEKTPGKFDFTGMLDIGRFLDLAADVGLYAIVRPGPFICAEWEFGGMPADLLTDDDLRLRCRDARFIERQARYLQALLAHVVPRQVTRGGNVIMLQVENEYGSFGDDKVYMRKMRDVYLENGVDVPLFTSDGPVAFYLRSGTVEGTLATGNFGGHVAENAAQLKSLVPEGPHMCTEYWCGWFDHWGEPHHVRDAADAADTFAQLLDSGCSVNVYMFHGGTNFGFMNGANFQERYEPTTTSYDYDAILSESGDLTAKFFAFRRVIEERFGALPPVRVKNSEKRAYGKVALDGCLPLAETLGAPIESAAPVDMEKLGQSYGYTLYRASFESFGEDVTLRVFNVRDRAIVFVDGVRVGVLYRRDGGERLAVGGLSAGRHTVELLNENMGRVTYGVHLRDPKGIDGVAVNDRYIFGWENYPLPMERLGELSFGPYRACAAPAFYAGSFEVDEPADTFLDVTGFGKGFAVINGFNLGRFWPDEGPQKRLYVPAPVLRRGRNDIRLFETEGRSAPFVTLTDAPDLG